MLTFKVLDILKPSDDILKIIANISIDKNNIGYIKQWKNWNIKIKLY